MSKANTQKALTGANSRSDELTKFCAVLRAELGDAIYSSWFTRLELDRIADGCAYLSVPTKFLKSWIHAHYYDKLRAIALAQLPAISEICLSVRTTTFSVVGAEAEPAGQSRVSGSQAAAGSARPREMFKEANTGVETSVLDTRMNFSTFLVSKSNQLAFSAAQEVSRSSSIYNPFYVHAGVGLGKTHLVQAIAHNATVAGRNALYLTAEKFMYSFVSALKAQTSLSFKESLRGIDILIVDDVQFLQGKTIQQEFCHTINALIDNGRQVVIACDRVPNELDNLDERIRSRLAGGLCVEIHPLDDELRLNIVEARVAATKIVQPAFDVSPAVVKMVANLIRTNGRDLDGAVNRLLAHTTLVGSVLSMEQAENAIRDLIRHREAKRIKIEDIQKLVATHFNVSRADILSSRRTANVVKPRQIAMYLAKILTPRSLPEIGRRFGGRDHTTVLHAVRKIDGLVAQDNSLKRELDLLKQLLED
ncbi:chromosomal replication initiation protein DnaA [Rhodoblastus sphagnicola]|uniref:Chromosomal replication initiator protein DnaA n=1 Tax=Rhodoblastus sphagnicola TaxID=333368 RepID=A0A2S6NC08_9HYPH|nr:chromosomal replication initiator protein DnaA [Rhodoblastus sphagnicola]MBB4197458.1 chromosomal replication initiator protein [Rhodoblastus sphagnicola]PPQ32162.1 chromosomal replication initiation protein DnaA [Rhodoblastus sphagnicola]